MALSCGLATARPGPYSSCPEQGGSPSPGDGNAALPTGPPAGPSSSHSYPSSGLGTFQTVLQRNATQLQSWRRERRSSVNWGLWQAVARGGPAWEAEGVLLTLRGAAPATFAWAALVLGPRAGKPLSPRRRGTADPLSEALGSTFPEMLHHSSLLACARAQSCPTLQPQGLWPARPLCPWGSPGKNTGVGCHFLLQGIFRIQGSNPGLLHWQILYQ